MNELPAEWVLIEKIDGECFSEINHEYLKQWNVTSFGDRCSILRLKKPPEFATPKVGPVSQPLANPDVIKSRMKDAWSSNRIE